MQVKENTEVVIEKIECLGKLWQRYGTTRDVDLDSDLIEAVESKLKELIEKL